MDLSAISSESAYSPLETALARVIVTEFKAFVPEELTTEAKEYTLPPMDLSATSSEGEFLAKRIL